MQYKGRQITSLGFTALNPSAYFSGRAIWKAMLLIRGESILYPTLEPSQHNLNRLLWIESG